MFLVVASILGAPSYAANATDTGAGILYTLPVTQDVTLEREGKNYNYLKYLLVAKHPQYPLKRSLVQFEDLPTACSANDILIANMYLYFHYAHKASSQSVAEAPNIFRPLAVQRILKRWEEAEATSTQRMGGQPWNQPYLDLNNIDAEATPQGMPTYYHASRPSGYMEFNVTTGG
ncbi:MAG: hypothetical protein GKR94_29385 [Gammaproteobacteria bacterium]|nr:hypothetical protein [Gammaproteobacteria bacterium]